MWLLLPDDLFPPVLLAEEEMGTLSKLADVCVHDAVDQFERFYVDQRGIVDEKQWRLVKRCCGLSAFVDRTLVDVVTTARAQAARGRAQQSAAPQSSVHSSSRPAMSPGPTVGKMSLLSTNLHAVLVAGTIEGKLCDLMYGLHHTTTREVRQIKSSYIHDKILDSKVLAAIVEPSAAEPLRGLHIKWALNEYAPLLGLRVARKVACGNFQSSGVVEVFIKGFVDSMGDIPASFAILGTSKALLTFQDTIYCGQMKKHIWLFKYSKKASPDEASGATKLQSKTELQKWFLCAVCERKLPLAKWRTCQMCGIRLCTMCVMTRNLSFIGRAPSDKVVRYPIDFCAA